MIQVYNSAIPKTSRLSVFFDRCDFSECFASQKLISSEVTASFVLKKLLQDPPRYVLMILSVRDFFFRLAGLKTSDIVNPINFVDVPVQREKSMIAEIGMSYNTPEEVICGLNDKHLNFAVSVFVINTPVDNNRICCEVFVSTILKYNNIWGRIYFTLIRFIHATVIKSMLQKLMSAL